MTGPEGYVNTTSIDENCKRGSEGHPLDVLWRIETDENTKVTFTFTFNSIYFHLLLFVKNGSIFQIYLNFTGYNLNKPNECEQNAVQVFGHKTEEKYRLEINLNKKVIIKKWKLHLFVFAFNHVYRLAYYCGSIANPVTTKDTEGNEKGNIMHVRLYATSSGKNSDFSARYTAFRSLDPNRDGKWLSFIHICYTESYFSKIK